MSHIAITPVATDGKTWLEKVIYYTRKKASTTSAKVNSTAFYNELVLTPIAVFTATGNLKTQTCFNSGLENGLSVNEIKEVRSINTPMCFPRL